MVTISPSIFRLAAPACRTYACGRLVMQDGISVHVNPIGGLGGHVAPLTIGMVVGRGGLERLVRVEPRPSPPVAPQRIVGVRSLAVSHHDEPALELVGVAYCAGGHLVRRGREDLFHQNGAVRELPRLPVAVDRAWDAYTACISFEPWPLSAA